MIRIWDCFLLEGTKVLFRFAIAVLSIHESEVLRRTDTISVIKILKASVRLTYDHEGLCNLAFDNTQPFPSRSEIERKQKWYLDLLRERLSRKKQLRHAFASITVGKSGYPTIELVAFSTEQEGSGFVCAGDQSTGFIMRLNLADGASIMQKLEMQFDCKILSMVIRENQIAYVSLLSGTILWELKVPDCALKLLYHDGILYAALANGILTIIE
ncbi:unnamed protein product, partial [Gongylonema pulchrum]|uniref:Rab-GAP TBC domain-containing protein n=1 Tax=Gongylonema pulchrum TaxID=637853 RepID=A0A183EEH7_9BILA